MSSKSSLGTLTLALVAAACTTLQPHADLPSSEIAQVSVTTAVDGVSQADVDRVRREAAHALEVAEATLSLTASFPLEIQIVGSGISRWRGRVLLLPIYHVRNRKAPIVHAVARMLMNPRHSQFFRIGVAVYLQGEYGEDDGFPNLQGVPLDRLVRKYKTQLVPIERLAADNDVFRRVGTQQREIAYVQAGSFATFLAKTYGEHTLREMHENPGATYRQVYGKPLEELAVQWRQSVFGDGAAARPADTRRGPTVAAEPATKEEIMSMGNEITQERLASYDRFDCEQIENEFAHTAARYEHQATPRTFKRAGTVEIFVGGDVRYILAIRQLMKVASDKDCKVRSIDCSKYPKTCQAL